MTQIGERAFVSPPQPQHNDTDESVQELKVRVLLFFDGTLNNRSNVEHRENETDLYEKYKTEGSYQNGRSNIALLEANLNKAIDGYDAVISVYTEGAGTEDAKKDSLIGYALGAGDTGIKSKAEQGIVRAVTQLEKKLSIQTEDFLIKSVDVDLFGFSRGAATARYCAYQLSDVGDEPLKERLETRQLPTENVTINFVGLFDTVSSHGVIYRNDVATLKLDAIHQANKVVQLEASEEYREKFSLTTIDSALSKNVGERVCLPGAHSDVGGGYTDEHEEQIVFRGDRDGLLNDYRWLIDQGWYRENELEVIPSQSYRSHQLKAKRALVKSTYARIPLDIMRQRMEAVDMQFQPDFMVENLEIPSDDSDLMQIRDKIFSMLGSAEISQPETWHGQSPLLKRVRNRYFHMSARYSIGMKPRWKNGRRHRKHYEG